MVNFLRPPDLEIADELLKKFVIVTNAFVSPYKKNSIFDDQKCLRHKFSISVAKNGQFLSKSHTLYLINIE